MEGIEAVHGERWGFWKPSNDKGFQKFSSNKGPMQDLL